jgi:hypothetical protein
LITGNNLHYFEVFEKCGVQEEGLQVRNLWECCKYLAQKDADHFPQRHLLSKFYKTDFLMIYGRNKQKRRAIPDSASIVSKII